MELAPTARTNGWGVVATLVAADGSASHALPRVLSKRVSDGHHIAVRDFADAVHAVCALHGRHPGVIDHATVRNVQPQASRWFAQVERAFTVERSYLATLTAAAGPLPSTAGQAESEAAIIAQRHALDMLAQSDRTGCSGGAAIALIMDWATIRAVLDAAADRFGVTPPPGLLPADAETDTITAILCETPAIERAMAFGAQQLLAQHRGLWDLLEARASARNRN